MSDDIVRERTDLLLSTLTGAYYDPTLYLSKLEEEGISNLDTATLAVAMPLPPYSMKDLDKPMAPSTMVLPSDMSAFLAGHTKISTTYSGDWPEAEVDNRFGMHHPFHPGSNSCPLLLGAVHGEPHYVDHVLAFIGGPMSACREAERMMRSEVQPMSEVYGSPSMSMFDHYNLDRSRYPELTDEGYMEAKREELSDDYGLLSYLFGLEFQTPQQREILMGLLSELSTVEPDSPEARTLYNKMQEKAGIEWDRVLRNWRDRFTPLISWWARPSDKSGPTQANMDMESVERHFNSPWSFSDEGMVQNHNYHWWEPFQYWGGVGRDIGSLRSILQQSYSKIFNSTWLESLLFDAIPVSGRHMVAGSHFPSASNSEIGQGELAGLLSSDSQVDLDFERKRANWSGGSAHHHHLHPSEVENQGSVMTIPHNAYVASPFGRAMMSVSEHGVPTPQGPFIGQAHPNSNSEFHRLHNQQLQFSSNAITLEAMRLVSEVEGQFGEEVLASKPSAVSGTYNDVEANTVARGNIQQLIAAANYRLMRIGDTAGLVKVPVPVENEGELGAIEATFGPVSPNSETVVPPIFNTGNTDAWGHPMPATLTWKFNPDLGDIEFGVAEQPFTIMQRTAHETHVFRVDPAFAIKPIRNKDGNIRLLEPSQNGFTTLSTDLHKADDYEPTGVFGKVLIEPAHVVKDLGDLEDMKGFSGDWVVQKKPQGKRVLVKKSGKSIEPSLPSKVNKELKKIKGDFTMDAYLDGSELSVVDLLVHKGSDLSFEPLDDRINVLRTLYNSTDHVHFPAPSNCQTTDIDGLIKTISSFDKGEFLVRDATSTFIKDKELHPKWVLFANDEISKSKVYPPLPEISVNNKQIILEYPEIISLVKANLAEDENGLYIESYEGEPYLVKQAQSQEDIWIPPVAFVLKEAGGAAAGGTGTVMSSDAGTHNAVASVIRKPRKRKKKELRKAPAVNDDESDDIEHMMRRAVTVLETGDRALTPGELVRSVKGMTRDHLMRFGAEYGIERTEDGLYTLNEAIDDDIPDGKIKKFKYPRMNAASADGGAWSGMQADITAPMGPTEIMEEENTTFGDPKEGQDDDREDEDVPQLDIISEDIEKPEIQIEEGKATMRFPKKEKKDEEDEIEAQSSVRTDSV